MATQIAAETPSLDLTQPLPNELRPNMDHIVTEDDTPVDNIFSEKQQRLLAEPLYSSWRGRGDGEPFVALANVGLFYGINTPPVVPDMLLSCGVDVPEDVWRKPNRSYFVWEYARAPHVTIEIVSNQEGGEDTDKFNIYAQAAVSYYVIFDPQRLLSDDVLRGFELLAGVYQRLRTPLWFPHVELGLDLWRGRFENREDTWLRWVSAARAVIPTGAERALEEARRADEEHHRADDEQKRADQEQKRADQERNRADEEHDRAEKLAAQLRKLGIDPEG